MKKDNEIFADLQIHSKYARATSKNISIENLEKYARIKGLDLLGIGAFQHPLRRKEIDEKLKEDAFGILRTKTGFPFICQTEVSLMFSQGGKRRAVHLLIFAPNTKIADKITSYLGSKGRLDYDGRPIFGITCRDLVKDLKDIDDKIEIIPAHAWTPWFGLFGSQSGFNSVEECFLDQSKHIYAIETGLSSDPAMNWRLSKLDKYTILSNSDAHSFWPHRLGREATVFELEELSYDNIIKAIRTRKGLKETIEVSPLFGKYHLTGHRNCNFSCSPEEAKKLNWICPVCKKKLTIGVEERIEELADRPIGYKPKNAIPFKALIPLQELLAVLLKTSATSKRVWTEYNKLIERFGNEFNILLRASSEELNEVVSIKTTDPILTNRDGKVKIKGGFDGQYGIPILETLDEKDLKVKKGQKGLGDFM